MFGVGSFADHLSGAKLGDDLPADDEGLLDGVFGAASGDGRVYWMASSGRRLGMVGFGLLYNVVEILNGGNRYEILRVVSALFGLNPNT
jgi:hypothetical protein